MADEEGDQDHVVHEVCDLRLREGASWSKEATGEGLRADAAKRCEEICPVVPPKGADFDEAPVAQRLNDRVLGCLRDGHGSGGPSAQGEGRVQARYLSALFHPSSGS